MAEKGKRNVATAESSKEIPDETLVKKEVQPLR